MVIIVVTGRELALQMHLARVQHDHQACISMQIINRCQTFNFPCERADFCDNTGIARLWTRPIYKRAWLVLCHAKDPHWRRQVF